MHYIKILFSLRFGVNWSKLLSKIYGGRLYVNYIWYLQKRSTIFNEVHKPKPTLDLQHVKNSK